MSFVDVFQSTPKQKEQQLVCNMKMCRAANRTFWHSTGCGNSPFSASALDLRQNESQEDKSPEEALTTKVG